MAVLKFSQISTTGSNLTSSDFLLAVQGGTADVLFTPAQVFRFANLTYASNVLSQLNTATAQGFFVYNTTDSNTSPGNYERGVFDWTTTANTLTIGVQILGSSSARNIIIQGGSASGLDITFQRVDGAKIFGINSNQAAALVRSDWSFGFSSAGDLATLDTALARGAAGIFKFASSQSFSANTTVATVLGSLGPAGANTTVQEWLTIKNASGTTRYIPCF